MNMESYGYDEQTGKPLDKTYLEKDIPRWLQNSIQEMKKHWAILDAGKEDFNWDTAWCELNSDINVAEVEQCISREQAWYLREKYLRTAKEDNA